MRSDEPWGWFNAFLMRLVIAVGVSTALIALDKLIGTGRLW